MKCEDTKLENFEPRDTVHSRDTTEQERIKIEELQKFLSNS